MNSEFLVTGFEQALEVQENAQSNDHGTLICAIGASKR
jgi:hypothetical protein